MKKYTLEDELKNCFKYFNDFTNFQENSKGYGLTRDNSLDSTMSSLAASGFMLASLISGVEHHFISYHEGKKKTLCALKTIYQEVPHYKGLLCHFAEYQQGCRFKKCEFSTIDTCLFLGGAILVDSYFNDEQISHYTNLFLNRIDWNYFLTDYHEKKVVRMAYNEFNFKTKQSFEEEKDGFIFQWHMYAEQLMMYLLIAGDERVSKKDALALFHGFRRDKKKDAFVRCPTGSLFTYQFSHCFFDFKNYVDDEKYDWFTNSKKACLDNYEYCKDHVEYKTFQLGLWGVSASDGPNGYRGYGIPPYDYDEQISYDERRHLDGTVAIYSIISSLPFIPDIVYETITLLNNAYPEVIGEYGYKDAINLDASWVSTSYIGIDKGSTLMMIENAQNGLFWRLFSQHPFIVKGLNKLDFSKVGV